MAAPASATQLTQDLLYVDLTSVPRFSHSSSRSTATTPQRLLLLDSSLQPRPFPHPPIQPINANTNIKMPIFGHKNKDAPVDPTPHTTHNNASRHSYSSNDGSPRRGFFNRRRSSSPNIHDSRHSPNRNSNKLSHNSTRTSGGLFNRHPEDPSIAAARERVMSAENAERGADRALVQARVAVKEAREHIKHLEREAAEEYVLPTY